MPQACAKKGNADSLFTAGEGHCSPRYHLRTWLEGSGDTHSSEDQGDVKQTPSCIDSSYCCDS
jgi:hypothetical protein